MSRDPKDVAKRKSASFEKRRQNYAAIVARVDATGMKVCVDCGRDLPVSEYYKRAKDDGEGFYWHSRCIDCHNVRVNQWKQEHPEKTRYIQRKFLLKPYGLTPEQYERMLKEQHGLCAICSQPPADGKVLHVDHDHGTNATRQLLCPSCNSALGLFQDSLEIVGKAAAYLRVHKEVAVGA